MQGLPGEARLHSDKRFDQSDERSKKQRDALPKKGEINEEKEGEEIFPDWH